MLKFRQEIDTTRTFFSEDFNHLPSSYSQAKLTDATYIVPVN